MLRSYYLFFSSGVMYDLNINAATGRNSKQFIFSLLDIFSGLPFL